MDLPAAFSSCAMPTADESNHSATGTLNPHRTDGHNDGMYHANIASCEKNIPNLNLPSKKIKHYILSPECHIHLHNENNTFLQYFHWNNRNTWFWQKEVFWWL